MSLVLMPNFFDPDKQSFAAYTPGDDFYQMLIDAHRDLPNEQSELLNAKLVLLLANHIGDLQVLKQALEAARTTV